MEDFATQAHQADVLDLNINPQIFLETLLMEIRGATISFSAAKKKTRLSLQQKIAHEIEALEQNLQLNPNDPQTFTDIQLKRNQLEEIYKNEATGAFVRARTKHKVDGERPTRLFCSLEKHNGIQKYIPCLKVTQKENDREKEVTITEQKDIEAETVNFYSKSRIDLPLG